ncbi:MAG: hypothetical protein KDA20_09655 [Phycisphaerales bacterium]|nr:hypothetical protein [Phycisphaerales bacterium]
MSEYQADSFGRQRAVSIQVTQQQSPLAKWAPFLALPFFVPVLPLLGMATGWLAMKDIKTNAAHTGVGRAKFAMRCGLAFTIAQLVIGFAAWQYSSAARSAPQIALQAGQGGDVAAFVGQFDSPGEVHDMEQAFAFLTLLRDRYGEYKGADLQLPAKWYTSWRPFEPFDYDLRFSSGSVRATAQIVMQPDLESMGMPRMKYFVLHDAQLGDLRFPPDAKTAAALRMVADADDQ